MDLETESGLAFRSSFKRVKKNYAYVYFSPQNILKVFYACTKTTQQHHLFKKSISR